MNTVDPTTSSDQRIDDDHQESKAGAAYNRLRAKHEQDPYDPETLVALTQIGMQVDPAQAWKDARLALDVAPEHQDDLVLWALQSMEKAPSADIDHSFLSRCFDLGMDHQHNCQVALRVLRRHLSAMRDVPIDWTGWCLMALDRYSEVPDIQRLGLLNLIDIDRDAHVERLLAYIKRHPEDDKVVGKALDVLRAHPQLGSLVDIANQLFQHNQRNTRIIDIVVARELANQTDGLSVLRSFAERLMDDPQVPLTLSRHATLRQADAFLSDFPIQPVPPHQYIPGIVKQLRAVETAMPEAWQEQVETEAQSLLHSRSTNLETFQHPGARTTLILFRGIAYRGGVPLPWRHVLLRTLPVNLIYVKDTKRLAFTNGAPGLGTDMASSVAALKERLAGDTLPPIFWGQSAGSFGALLFARHFPNALMIGCGTITSSHQDLMRDDPRGRSVLNHVRRHHPEVILNFRDELVDVPLSIHLFYGEHHPHDARHALNLRGLPQVLLHPYPTDDHAILCWLIERGLHEDITELILGHVEPEAD